MENTKGIEKYLLYTLPFIIEYVFLQLTDFVDTTLSAHVNESTIVGVSTMVLIVVVIRTFSTVMASTNEILISRIYGKNHNEDSVNTITYNSLFLATIINGLACVLVFVFSNKIINIMGLTGKAFIISRSFLHIRIIGCLITPIEQIIQSKLKVIYKHKKVTIAKITYTILNIIGDTVAVIYGYGAIGIAVSTVFCKFIEVIILLIFNRGIQVRKISKKIIKELIGIYKLTIFSKLGHRIGVVIFTSFASNLNQTTYANYVLALQVMYLGTSISEALGESALIQVGHSIGKKDEKEIDNIKNIGKESSYIIALAQIIIFFVLAKPMLTLISNNTYNQTAVNLLYLLIVEMVFETLHYPLEGYLLAFKEMKYVTKVNLQGVLLIRLFLAFLFLKVGLDIYGIALALVFDYFIRYVRYYLYVKKYQKRGI